MANEDVDESSKYFCKCGAVHGKDDECSCGCTHWVRGDPFDPDVNCCGCHGCGFDCGCMCS